MMTYINFIHFLLLILSIQIIEGIITPIKGMNFSDLLRNPFNGFPHYREIIMYLRHLVHAHHSIASLENIGTTFEGRALYVFKISTGGINKPKILIDAGIHGNEWITSTTVVYVIHQLLNNKTNVYLYQDVDWYIIPNLNPDGYEYSLTNKRWWIKNRSANEGSSCYGTNLNRNFDVGWMGAKTSDNPCSNDYGGFTPFSESESKALRNLFRSNRGLIKVYLTLHSFGLYLLYPWRWTKISARNPELHEIGQKAVNAMRKEYNTYYNVRNFAKTMNEATGGSDDWMLAVGNGVDLSYSLQLPGHTILIPKLPIDAIGIETLQAFKVFHLYIVKKYGKNFKD